MNNLLWSSRFTKAVKKVIKRRPDLITKIELTLQKLEINIYEPSLFTHKLKGQFEGSWSCSVEYDYRIIFDILKDDKSGLVEILLLSIGTHDQVY